MINVSFAFERVFKMVLDSFPNALSERELGVLIGVRHTAILLLLERFKG